MTKAEVKAFRAQVDEAMRVIAEEHGMQYTPAKSMSYSKTDISYKIGFTTKSVEDLLDENRKHFEECAGMYGLKHDILGKPFVHLGKTYKVTGINPKGRKNVLRFEDENGSKYVGSVHILPNEYLVDWAQSK